MRVSDGEKIVTLSVTAAEPAEPETAEPQTDEPETAEPQTDEPEAAEAAPDEA